MFRTDDPPLRVQEPPTPISRACRLPVVVRLHSPAVGTDRTVREGQGTQERKKGAQWNLMHFNLERPGVMPVASARSLAIDVPAPVSALQPAPVSRKTRRSLTPQPLS